MRCFAIVTLLFIATSSALYEGDDCVVQETDQSRKCISFYNCAYAKKLLQAHQLPSHCGFNLKDPLVCCPSQKNQKSLPGDRSFEKCYKYHDVKNAVFGIALGTKVQPREFQHMGAIGYRDDSRIQWLCGGSVISEQFVITAAHCVKSQQYGPAKLVRLADLDLQSTDDGAHPEDVNIVQSFPHPDYRPPSHYNDIALLKLEGKKKNLPLDVFQITGWGKTDFLGEASSQLLKADVNIVQHQMCADRYANVPARKLSRGIADELQICAGDSEGTDACPGDSGGPLQFRVRETAKLSEHFVVVGVTSFGRGCGLENSAGVYTRVSTYIEWIENIVWPQN